MARKVKHDFSDLQLQLRIEGWARDGWDDKQIAEALGYNQTWFSELKGKLTELTEALKKGRQPLDIIVENSLYKRATGLKVKTIVKKFLLLPDGSQADTQVVSETIMELPPDTGAAMAWLKNRKPEQWNKQPEKHEVTGAGGNPLIPEQKTDVSNLTVEEMETLILLNKKIRKT